MIRKTIIIILLVITIMGAYFWGTIQSGEGSGIEIIPNNYIDINNVIDFDATETNLQLYTFDGNIYYWER